VSREKVLSQLGLLAAGGGVVLSLRSFLKHYKSVLFFENPYETDEKKHTGQKFSATAK